MFGNMFNDIVVQRLDTNGTTIQSIAVPIAYGPKEKFLVRLASDPDLDRQVAIQLPRMGFEVTGYTYDPTRRLQHTIRNVKVSATDPDTLHYQWTPVPYNLTATLSIFVRNADDGAQILEQILPYFGPEWTNTVNLIPSMGIKMDIPTVLNDVSVEDSYEGDFVTRRALIYSLTFTIKGYFYGPVRSQGVIKRTRIEMMAANGHGTITGKDMSRTGRAHRIIVQPAQYANGAPSTNAASSISYSLISANSDFGMASNTFFYSDGLKYDPIQDEDV
jgi:hypothetical protein